MDAFLSDRIAEVTIWARNNGYDDVARWMQKKVKREHDAERKPRTGNRKASLSNPLTGKPVRGGDFGLAMGDDWRERT